MKIKLKKELRAERRTVQVLAVTAVSLLFVSCIIEFVLRGLLCRSDYQSMHLDFFNSVSLGLAGSALISFLSLWFQFRDRRDTQVKSVTSILINIYADYILIYHLIQRGTNPQFDGDNYRLEKELSERTAALKKSIHEAAVVYRSAAFTSDTVEEMLRVLQDAVMFNLRRIETYCVTMLLPAYAGPSENETGNTSSDRSPAQNIIDKRVRKECCEYILTIIDERYSMTAFETMFSRLGLEDELFARAVNDMKDTVKAAYDATLATLECKLDISMRRRVVQLSDHHMREYFTEAYAIRKRLDEVAKKIDEEKRNDPQFISAVREIEELIQSDEIPEAQKMIEKLENSVDAT